MVATRTKPLAEGEKEERRDQMTKGRRHGAVFEEKYKRQRESHRNTEVSCQIVDSS